MGIEEKENKMQWLIDKVEMENIIVNTGKKKGSVNAPTGYGKSGFIFEDIIYHINNMKEDDKFIFNISAPILLLELQCVEGLSIVLREKFKEKVNNKEFMFFVNSSDNRLKYKEICANIFADTKGFEKIGDFLLNDSKKIAIVASCKNSLDKFSEKIDFIKSHKNVTVFNYIDESHLITDCDYIRNIFEKSDYLYTITATESDDIRKLIKDITGEKKPIVNIPASQAIKENIIVRPNPFYKIVDSSKCGYKITSEMLLELMEKFKNDKNQENIPHKILVSCTNSKNLIDLKEKLKDSKIKVFSTCVKDGSKSNENSEYLDIDEVDFIKNVDEYPDDCFILHIRRLIQGIDIKTITDAIIPIRDTHIDAIDKRTIIQTMGRALRTFSGERGKPEEERKKKYGNVVFVIEYGSSMKDAEERLSAMLYDYYGRDNVITFETRERNSKNNGDSNDDFSTLHLHRFKCPFTENDLEKLKINISKYITENLKREYESKKEILEEEFSFADYLKEIDAFKILKKKFIDCGFIFDESISLSCVFEDDELRSLINKVIDEQ